MLFIYWINIFSFRSIVSFSFSYFVFFASKHHHHLVHLLSGHQQQTISLLIMLVVSSQDKALWFHFELLFYCFHFMVFITLSLFTDQILSKKFLLLNYFFNIYIYFQTEPVGSLSFTIIFHWLWMVCKDVLFQLYFVSLIMKWFII